MWYVFVKVATPDDAKNITMTAEIKTNVCISYMQMGMYFLYYLYETSGRKGKYHTFISNPILQGFIVLVQGYIPSSLMYI